MARQRIKAGKRKASPSSSSLAGLKRQVSEAREEARRARRNELIAIGILVLLVIAGAYMFGSGITGLLTRGNTTLHTDAISAVFSESGEYTWTPASQGELTSAAISGKVVGSGSARVYLNDKLIYNSALDTVRANLITAHQVYETGNSTGTEPLETGPVSEPLPSEQLPLETPTPEPLPDGSLSSEPLTEGSVPAGPLPTGSLPAEQPPLPTEATSEQPAESPAAEVPLGSGQENSTEIAENATLPNNNATIPSEAGNTTAPAESPAGQPAEETPTEVPEVPIEPPVQVELPPEEIISVEQLETAFDSQCVDTCELSGLNETSYTIRVELDNASIVIDSIIYTIRQALPGENWPPVYVFNGTLEIPANQVTELNLTTFFTDANGDPLTCIALPGEHLFAASDSQLLTLSPDENFTGTTTLELYVSDGLATTISQLITVNVALAPSANETPIPAEGPAPGNLTQFTAEIGKPVKWQKRVAVENPTNETALMNVEAELPAAAEDITVYSKADERQIEKENILLTKHGITLAEYETARSAEAQAMGREESAVAQAAGLDKAEAVQDKASENRPEKEPKKEKEQKPKDITFEEEVLPGATNEYFVEYYTEAPQLMEEPMTNGKLITVSSATSYTDILTYADITEAPASKLRLYWYASKTDYAAYILGDALLADTLESDSYKVDITGLPGFNVSLVDSDANGLVERIEWITPHLSNQTFEISIKVLNPFTYLRDGETWAVAFETVGRANLTISSPNAGWTEFLTDSNETFDEMQFVELSCGNESLKSGLRLAGFDNATYDYSALSEVDSIDVQKLLISDYECNSTGYLADTMLKAGYATLLFEFSNENATVSDYAYDPGAPVISSLAIMPASPNSSSTLTCNATSIDEENTSLVVEWYWYRNGNLNFSGNTSVQNNTNSLIATVGAGNLTAGDTWNCTVRAFDGTNYSSFNSTAAYIAIYPSCPNTTGIWTLNTSYTYDGSMTCAEIIILGSGSLTHTANSGSQTYTLSINTDNLTIYSGGKIDISNKGYSNTNGPGVGGDHGAGAGHGGKGGNTSYNGNNNVGGNPYGSMAGPITIGSGGFHSWDGVAGGSGGGAVFINATNLIINGSILANGQTPSCGVTWVAGGGAGGSIYIAAQSASGIGTITANGGSDCAGGAGQAAAAQAAG